MKKYELTDITIEYYGRTLHWIKALKKFGNVKKGDIGGFVESEDNLSQTGSCWAFEFPKDDSGVNSATNIEEDLKKYNIVNDVEE